jgi:hypothetical protein
MAKWKIDNIISQITFPLNNEIMRTCLFWVQLILNKCVAKRFVGDTVCLKKF